jgi:hypothetical protein
MVRTVFTISRIVVPFGLAALFLAAFCNDVAHISAGDASPDVMKRVATLIEQLGDDSFHRRDEATAALIAIGELAEEKVLAASKNHDPEVRYRCRTVLRTIERNQIAQRRSAFLDGDIEKLKINARSWERYSQIVGNTRDSRELFLQMQIAAGDLLDEAEQKPTSCAQRVAQMYLEDTQLRRFGGQGTDSGRVAAMVFIAANKGVSLDSQAMSQSTSLLYRYRSHFDENDTAFRELLAHWVRSKANSATQQYQFLRLTQQFQLKEGIDLARKMITAGGSSSYKAQAMLTLGKLGTRDDVALLEKQIDNDGALASTGSKTKRKTCKLGDVALAICVVLNDQKLVDFGFQDAPEGRPVSTSYVQYGFYTDEQRQAARQKWESWNKSRSSR